MANLSFSKILKEELAHIKLNEAEKKIQLKTVIYTIGIINFNSFQTTLELKIQNAMLAKDVIKTLKIEYPKLNIQIAVQKVKSFKNNKTIYIVGILSEVNQLLYDLNLINNPEQKIIFSMNNFLKQLQEENLIKVYIRTFWILCGTINDPQKQSQYHLEFVNTNKDKLLEVQNKLEAIDINMKISKRKNNYPLYLNKSEEISDFLKYVGANKGLFDFEDFRILRDFHNTNNRMNNAEIANEVKKQKSANEQIEAIQLLFRKEKLDKLPSKTAKIAKIRMENPDATLAELSEITNGEISKSNVSYHLKNIIKLAKEERDE